MMLKKYGEITFRDLFPGKLMSCIKEVAKEDAEFS